MKLLKINALLLFFIFLAPFVRGEDIASWKADKSQSAVEFTAVGKPGFLRINGTGGKISGTAETKAQNLEGSFETDLNEFTTGIDMRDEHMKKKYLETDKYPTATLHWVINGGIQNNKSEVFFHGKLLLHGVEREVSGTANVVPSNDKKSVDVEAKFAIKLSDFKINIPTYLGVTVAEDVQVRVVVKASEEKLIKK